MNRGAHKGGENGYHVSDIEELVISFEGYSGTHLITGFPDRLETQYDNCRHRRIGDGTEDESITRPSDKPDGIAIPLIVEQLNCPKSYMNRRQSPNEPRNGFMESCQFVTVSKRVKQLGVLSRRVKPPKG